MDENKIPPRFYSNSTRFLAALALTAELHADQTRKDTDIPYISHLLGVAGIAIEYGANETEAIAALLHDAPEDKGGRATLERIRRDFGDDVAKIVDGCTDTYEDPKPDWRVRKPAYIAHIRGASPSVRLVSAADKLHNARSILMDYRRVGDAVFDRFKKGTKYHTLWYYRRLADAFVEADSESAIARELDRVVSKIERLVDANSGAEGLAEKEKVYREMDSVLEKQSQISSEPDFLDEQPGHGRAIAEPQPQPQAPGRGGGSI